MANDNTEKLLRTIRALRAKAEDPSVTEAEAMMFTAKVAELLAKHGLEEAQLSVEEQSGLEHEAGEEKEWNKSQGRKILVSSVCRLYMVQCYMTGPRWTLIGRRASIAVAREMVNYLLKTTVRLSNEYARATGGSRTEFRKGCLIRLAQRVTKMRLDQERSAAPKFSGAGNPGNLPALYMTELDLAQQYMRDRLGIRKLGTARAKVRFRSETDAAAGARAGDSVSLSPQLGGGGAMLIGGRK